MELVDDILFKFNLYSVNKFSYKDWFSIRPDNTIDSNAMFVCKIPFYVILFDKYIHKLRIYRVFI